MEYIDVPPDNVCAVMLYLLVMVRREQKIPRVNVILAGKWRIMTFRYHWKKLVPHVSYRLSRGT